MTGIAGGFYGGRKAPEIVEWIEKKMLPQSTLITDEAALDELIAVRMIGLAMKCDRCFRPMML